MAGHHPLRRNPCHLVEYREPATDAAVAHRNMAQKHQVAAEQRSAGLVQYGEIAVRMRGAPRSQLENPLSEVELHLLVDREARWNQPHLVDQVRAHAAAKCVDVEWAACRQCL